MALEERGMILRADRQFKKGELLLITIGEYSDYSVHGIVRCLHDFGHREVLEAYLNYLRLQNKYKDDHVDLYEIMPWMIGGGWVEEVETTEVHLGDYGRLEIPE